MRRFEEFTLGEILEADFRSIRVFRNLGIDSSTFKERTVKEICKKYHIQSENLLDSIVDNMESKAIFESHEVS
ncbi:hypothetical protein [Aquiflexum lacus]|uniref:hypothetical protein n=1 Tax=Aquiflexum lacus TaxID=2483805 RepID=UPI001894827A|nr:hypothetical protein [Aquiflexum lacus]